jgi:hypothetical protein
MKMSYSDEASRASARLLDPRFHYTPSAQTDISATWRRFGFDPSANEQRRQSMLSRMTEGRRSASISTALNVLGVGSLE